MKIVLLINSDRLIDIFFPVLGMNYTLINDSLIVGSQPQKPEDLDHLKQEENVAYILNLQQDKDVEYWGIDLQSIIKRCRELGIHHMRKPVIKFLLLLLRSCTKIFVWPFRV